MFLCMLPALARAQSGGSEKDNPASSSLDEQKTPREDSTSLEPLDRDSPAPIASLPSPTPIQTAADAKTDKSTGKQTARMFWVVPNFAAVSADTQLPPLSVGEKFSLARQDSVDYSAFVWTAMLSFQSLALDSDPEFGHGFKGYSCYYWRAFVDQASGAFFTEAIIPALTHEDPRYYTLGHGRFFRRSGYALSRIVVTKTDSGGTSFNFSEIGGNIAEAGLANLYYPKQERGFSKTALNWAAQIEAAALNNIIREFWPDIRHKFLRQK